VGGPRWEVKKGRRDGLMNAEYDKFVPSIYLG
jgi:hypothetical protein